jgi:hypothetical protein
MTKVTTVKQKKQLRAVEEVLPVAKTTQSTVSGKPASGNNTTQEEIWMMMMQVSLDGDGDENGGDDAAAEEIGPVKRSNTSKDQQLDSPLARLCQAALDSVRTVDSIQFVIKFIFRYNGHFGHNCKR